MKTNKRVHPGNQRKATAAEVQQGEGGCEATRALLRGFGFGTRAEGSDTVDKEWQDKICCCREFDFQSKSAE